MQLIGQVRRPWAWLAVAAAVMLGLAWAVVPGGRPAPVNLASELPPGALMTLESPDFGKLLASWNQSPEQAAWLNSANESAFETSRLFGGLEQAQLGFMGAAGGDVGSGFLRQVAGKETIFAWYDIGKLEFLYITRLPPGRAAQVDLLRRKGKFQRREAAGTSFFVRTATAADATGDDTADARDDAADASADASAATSSTGDTQPRTVAFATRGDWLLLSTREDLMANALILMAAPPDTPNRPSSMQTEGWFAAASDLDRNPRGDLHMLLDLGRVTHTPQFRTYWLQRNVTELRAFRAAAVDLYREPNNLREERVLLPATPIPETDGAALAGIEGWVPERSGVYRAWSQPKPEEALAALEDKVLAPAPMNAATDTTAPNADMHPAEAGNASDLESRIDTPARQTDKDGGRAALKTLLGGADVRGMLTLSRSEPSLAGQLFVPVSSAVVLRAGAAWDRDRLAATIAGRMRARLTATDASLGWKVQPDGSMQLNDAAPLTLFIDGDTAVLATDPALMREILAHRKSGAGSAVQAGTNVTRLAAFRHAQEREGFHRLTAALDFAAAPAERTPTDTGASTPAFFRDIMGSLSDSFKAFTDERFVESRDASAVRQTVVYTIRR